MSELLPFSPEHEAIRKQYKLEFVSAFSKLSGFPISDAVSIMESISNNGHNIRLCMDYDRDLDPYVGIKGAGRIEVPTVIEDHVSSNFNEHPLIVVGVTLRDKGAQIETADIDEQMSLSDLHARRNRGIVMQAGEAVVIQDRKIKYDFDRMQSEFWRYDEQGAISETVKVDIDQLLMQGFVELARSIGEDDRGRVEFHPGRKKFPVAVGNSIVWKPVDRLTFSDLNS